MVLKKCEPLLAGLVLLGQLVREGDGTSAFGKHWETGVSQSEGEQTHISGDGSEGNFWHIAVPGMGAGSSEKGADPSKVVPGVLGI